MCAPLERLHAYEHADVPSYADVIGLLRQRSRERVTNGMRMMLPRNGILPHPKKDEPYATVELDYAGDFGDGKDPAEYALRMLELD